MELEVELQMELEVELQMELEVEEVSRERFDSEKE